VRFAIRAALVLGGAVAGVAASAGTARADASAWVFAGGGPMLWKQTTTDTTLKSLPPDKLTAKGALTFDVGMGTTPNAPIIVGGVFRLMPMLGYGVDLGLLARGATRGYQAGGFGLALDLGGYWRTWGEGSVGFLGDVVLGAPLGLEMRLVGAAGKRDALALGAIFGIDLLRLTVFRKASYWPNPSPAQDMPSYARLP
jgi:hypothetical protein